MESASRSNGSRVGFDHVFFIALQYEAGSAFLDAEELINRFMHFVADLFGRQRAHDHQLRIFACMDHLSKTLVFKRQFFNITSKTCHFFLDFQFSF